MQNYLNLYLACKQQQLNGPVSYRAFEKRAPGQGFPLVTIKHNPWLLLLENRRKRELKEIPSCLIPHLLIVFAQELEILVTALFLYSALE